MPLSAIEKLRKGLPDVTIQEGCILLEIWFVGGK
jgi:hypothetical protein